MTMQAHANEMSLLSSEGMSVNLRLPPLRGEGWGGWAGDGFEFESDPSPSPDQVRGGL